MRNWYFIWTIVVSYNYYRKYNILCSEKLVLTLKVRMRVIHDVKFKLCICIVVY